MPVFSSQALYRGPIACLVVSIATTLGSGCTTYVAPSSAIDFAGPPAAGNSGVRIPGLQRCQPGRLEPIRTDQRLAILVHGQLDPDGEPDQFPRLAMGLHKRGMQALCFHYDYTDRLDLAAASLRRVLDGLAKRGVRRVSVIGYSLGALVARRAVTDKHPTLWQQNVHLVTIAGPFSGIERSNVCGKTWAHVLTLGLTAAICLGVTGHKWRDIPPAAAFITDPGPLSPLVSRVLRIVTDEPVGDRAFTVAEQRFPQEPASQRVTVERVRAGHRAVVQLVPGLMAAHGLIEATGAPPS